jgi:hypothetical protein
MTDQRALKYRSQGEVQDSPDWPMGDSVKNRVVPGLRIPEDAPS